jgi:GT2 family glycosyltransferase
MEGTSIIIPVYNKYEATVRCVDHIRENNPDSLFEIIIVDNGSTDKTRDIFSEDPNLIYLRNSENLGISKAYNLGSRVAKYNILCFMHNDVLVILKNWVDRAKEFLLDNPKAGVVGLYGARAIRKDGSFRGKTIIHSKDKKPAIDGPFERVAVVDGLLLMLKRAVFEEIEGFNDAFTIHYYDKDVSLRAHNRDFLNYVISIPFQHQCATTRREIRKDDEIRREAREKFLDIWNDILPVDTSSLQDKMKYIISGIKNFPLGSNDR